MIHAAAISAIVLAAGVACAECAPGDLVCQFDSAEASLLQADCAATPADCAADTADLLDAAWLLHHSAGNAVSPDRAERAMGVLMPAYGLTAHDHPIPELHLLRGLACRAQGRAECWDDSADIVDTALQRQRFNHSTFRRVAMPATVDYRIETLLSEEPIQ